jgi:hypothetical protein
MFNLNVCGLPHRRRWRQWKREPDRCRSPAVTVVASPVCPELDPLTLSLHLDTGHASQGVADNPIMVELVASLSVTQTAGAPPPGLAAPAKGEPPELPSTSVCPDAGHAGRDVVEDPMVVEVVA